MCVASKLYRLRAWHDDLEKIKLVALKLEIISEERDKDMEVDFWPRADP